ncbi:MAG: hypothetical protein KDB23_17440 [Planctomycetales bacterium]|nr:hypothetical protein [Planctomycetales bacterium]
MATFELDIPFELTTSSSVEFVAMNDGGVSTGVLSSWSFLSDSDIPGDFSGNGVLDVNDLALLFDATWNNNLHFDLTNDDVVDLDDIAFWVRDIKQTYFGDVDLDGEFNSADLVNVFQTGEYEDDVVGNSIWLTGDWNADGEFTTSDLVIAFQDGGYEHGPRTAVTFVPEPSGVLLGGISLLGIFASARRRWRAPACVLAAPPSTPKSRLTGRKVNR